MMNEIRDMEAWKKVLDLYPEAFLYHEYKKGGFWFYRKPEDRDGGNPIFYVKDWKSGQYQFKEGRPFTPTEGDSFFTDHLTGDCYWWVPGLLNERHKTKETDLLGMVDFEFWNVDLESLFQEVVSSFDEFRTQVFSREQWQKIRKIAAEKGGIWDRVLGETDAWSERTFKRLDAFTLRCV